MLTYSLSLSICNPDPVLKMGAMYICSVVCWLKLPNPPVPRAKLLKGQKRQSHQREEAGKRSFFSHLVRTGLTTDFLDDKKSGGVARLACQRNEPGTLSPWVWPGV